MSVSPMTPSFDAPGFEAPNFDGPTDAVRTPVAGSLAHDLATGSTTAALTFAGQGWRWWDELADLLDRRSWIRPRAATWARTLAEFAESPAIRDLGGAPSGFDPLAWVDGGVAPSTGELMSLPLSLPGVLLTQLLAYREAWEDGLAAGVDAGSIVAATGHSGGVIAAAAVAAQPGGLADDELLRPFLQLSVLLGHVAGTCAHAVSPSVLDAAASGDLDAATPMVAVSGVRLDRLEQLLASVDDAVDGRSDAARIALVHGPTRAVVSGSPAALAAARRALTRAVAADPSEPKLVWEPLAVSAPCHHPVLGEVHAEVVARAAELELVLPLPAGPVALVSPDGPRVLGSSGNGGGNGGAGVDLVDELVAAMLTNPGRWTDTAVALSRGSLGLRPAHWLLDLGPSDGVAKLAGAAARGTGTQVLALSGDDGRRSLVTIGATPDGHGGRYEQYAPRVVRLEDGTTRIENHFTRATGRSPMVLPGMTPTTVDAGIVANAANAGFLAELAGGGQVTEAIFAERVAELTELLDPGQEVVFNALHLDPYLWGLHLGRQRIVQAARRAGAPICGVTISAGVPETDDAVALLDELAELGMWCNAFKPGTVDQIRRVVEIARAAPRHTVFVHVEGGTAGGHHSWVDLEDLLLGGYHLLREQPNVVLCVGGGIGTPERAAELLTGTWSLRHTGVLMPCDAVLLGTVTMAVAEATATPGVKQALRDAIGRAAGGTDAGFVRRGQVEGQITSGRSGLDADIHFLDNAASRCAALLDQVAGDADAVERRHDEIVDALARTAKPWFGDVAEMTYEQLLRRFVELTALGRGGRYEDGAWLDVSHRDRFVELLQRSEARLDPAESGSVTTLFGSRSSVDDPHAAIGRLLDAHPAARNTLLHPADPAFFLAVCRRAGKPVPFVPVIDADVRRWYQSDSLWQAQHDAFDAEQVLIIPGPAAVGGIDAVDEPVAELLGRFEQHLAVALESEGVAPVAVTRLRRRGATAELRGVVAAVLEAETVVVDGRIRPNPVRAFGPVEDWALRADGAGHLSDATRQLAHATGDAELVELVEAAPGEAVLRLNFPALPTGEHDGAAPDDVVELRLRHRCEDGVDIVELDTTARAEALATMLREVLLRGAAEPVALGATAHWRTTADPARRRAHARTVQAAAGAVLPDGWLAVVWPAVFAALGADEVVGHLLDLVHLEHRVVVLDAEGVAAAAEAPTDASASASIVAISPHDAGTQVDTVAVVEGPDGPLVRIEGAFLLRGVEDLRADELGRPVQPGATADSDDDAADSDAAVTDDDAVQDRPRRTLGRIETRAPATLTTFAAVSGDHNPIHRSVAVARLAGLDGPIAHGAWTSALAQRAVVELAADGDTTRLVEWSAKFVAPVPPSASLTVNVVRTGVCGGTNVVEATVVVRDADGAGVPALLATARVAPPRTAYLFPGQGIQRPGMGMDGYERSAAAKRIWDRADAYTRERLGFSILSIVRDNPTVIRADGEVHRHPQGVLHLTQFTQVAMASLASAQVAELREQGVFDPDAVCAGHSVGEYNALAAVAGVLDLEAVVELVFRRGQAMHHLVPRDAAGNSDYRLGVVRPHEIGMDHEAAEALIAEVRDRLGATLEIVNFNLRGKQYAVAGTVAALDELERELVARARPGSRPAFLLVPGIDVPFHSSVLRDGVAEFRTHLEAGLPERVDPTSLVGRYVPNLVPRIFSLERDFVEEVATYVDSVPLRAVLDEWERWSADPGRLCRELLIELLAWQFASPVRWIETQDLLFSATEAGGLGIDRVVEIGVGSAPTVANLARGTLALADRPFVTSAVQHVEGERALVFALDEDPEPEPVADETPTDDAPAAPAPAAPVAPAPAAASASGPVADLGVDAADAMRLLLALLSKVRVEQLSGAESIDDLVDGVSSRRNQLLMDLGAEFNIAGVDGARELPLDRLATELAARAGRYSFPGPVLRDARESALAPVLGPRRIKARDVHARVTGHWGLGEGWVDRTLVALAFDTRDGESTRGGALARLAPLPNQADDAIDAALQLSAADAGVVLPVPGAAGGGGSVDAAAVAELEARLVGPDGLLARIARDTLDRVAPESDSEDEVDTSTEDRLALLDREHGDRRAAAIAPSFDARRHVAFTSWWATARHDVVALHHAGLGGSVPAEQLDAEAARLARHVVDPGVRASAAWFAGRADARGDAAAADRFRRILAGGAWSVPLQPTIPTLEIVDGERVAIEAPAPAGRLDDLTALLGSRDEPWAPALAEQLDRLRGTHANGPGADLSDQVALVTGASPGSIAVEVVRHLLAGGATVVCTTSSATPERLAFYRELYRVAAAPGAELHVVPANLASFSDVDDLVDWMLSPVLDRSGGVVRTLKDPMVPTLVLPFAAGPVAGDLADVGPAAEVAMRVLLWGVERLVGRIAESIDRSGSGGATVRVLLPQSPNHGGFGGDGAYGEAKAALEVISEKWTSEHARWGAQVELVAATIGWVRGTGLMEANGALGALVERDLGVRTFSSAEMGWLLAAWCSPSVAAPQGAPVRVDLSGGLGAVGSLRDAMAPLVAQLQAPLDGADAASTQDGDARIPALLSPVPADEPVGAADGFAAPSRPLEDMVVVVGMGEVGPWGTSATRFDLEVDGELADGSVAELAWTCGLIRWESDLDDGSWVDVESDEPVAESELAERYREAVHERCGIRTFDVDGPLDPAGVELFVEVFLDHDVVVSAADEHDARAFAAADPEQTSVRRGPDGDWQVVRRAGSSIRVPRRAVLTRRVGAQVPEGFDPTRWGIPTEMAASVDRLSLWNLVATVEAFLDAGIEPEELMARVHPAMVGSTQGSGMGGMSSVQTLYRDSVLGGDHANDLLQEGLANVVAAYVVQSYVGGYGPMVHPVAACATAAVSIEDGVDKIRAGKADVIVAGGWDDLQLEGVLGFSTMNATAPTEHMEAMGLEPAQFSRANDRRRAGFVEAQGGGTVLLARGSVAADLGLPVRGVVVYASSFADGIHTSIPAPGLGALACVLGGESSPLGRALAEHGLAADDVAVVSKHDTSTGANDPNESELHERIAGELGRSEGNPMLVVSQKTVTGHAKGGSAAWQTIGLLQVLESGQVPGNRNLECLDTSHRDHTALAYGHREIVAGEPLRAGLLTSLGFGHVSAVLCLAHPGVFAAALNGRGRDHAEAAARRRLVGQRRRLANRYEVEPAYTKRVDRRLVGDDDSDERHEAEVRLLTDPAVRLGGDGTYLTDGADLTGPARADRS
jgi:fatty acid synthase